MQKGQKATPNQNPYGTLQTSQMSSLGKITLWRRSSGELKAALEGGGVRVKAALTAQPENKLQCTYP